MAPAKKEIASSPPAASPVLRLVAMLIDLVILALLYVGGVALVVVWGVSGFSHLASFSHLLSILTTLSAQLFLVPLIFPSCYFVVFHALGGQTIGKVCLGLQLVSAQGGSVSLATSYLRYVCYLVSLLPFGLGYLWAFLDDEALAWHDQLAGTRVIAADPA
ncbi:MAG: RDD family protein [Thermodesulfobacteriota bacterium]